MPELLDELIEAMARAHHESLRDKFLANSPPWGAMRSQYRKDRIAAMRAALALLPQAQVPEGWKLVPIVMTDDMAAAFARRSRSSRTDHRSHFHDEATNAWDDFLSASPPAPVEGEKGNTDV